MFSLRKPTYDQVRSVLAKQQELGFSYTEVGASRGDTTPSGFTPDHSRIRLGRGSTVFERAFDALTHWKVFDFPGVQLCWPETAVRAGSAIGILISLFGMWALNVCRVVYTLDEKGPVLRKVSRTVHSPSMQSGGRFASLSYGI